MTQHDQSKSDKPVQPSDKSDKPTEKLSEKTEKPAERPAEPAVETEPFAVSDPEPESVSPEPEPEVAPRPVRVPQVVAGGATMEPGVVQHSREQNVGGRVASSAYGVGNTGQGALLAGGQVRTRAFVPEASPTHHESAEEAVARMQRSPGRYWPITVLPGRPGLQASGGWTNPSPTMQWFDQGTRDEWYRRSRENMNQW
jgi:hypothetical protein